MSSFLCLGQDNYRVPLQLFQENRSKLAKKLLKTSDNNTKFYIVLQGGKSPQRYDTDHEPIFRQESYFWYLTGVKEPDCSIVLEISGNDADPTIRTTLLIPKLPESYATIMGHIKTCEEWKNEYGVDQVLFTERLQSYLEEQTTSTGQRILLLQGLNTDSDTMYQELIPTFLEESQVMKPFLDYDTLFPILAECRVIKSPLELALLEHVSQVSSFAHTYVMRNTRPGMYEYQCESLFKHYTYYNYGSRLQSYTSICGCGPNAAVLHYGHTGEPNSRKIASDDNCLFDMGAEYQCYASDITCSFPASGKFSPKYQPIYEAVLNAQRAVIAMIEPGVSWVDCHERAELEILKGLYKIGIVVLPKGKNGTTDEEEKKNNNNGDKDHELDETIIETLKELVHNHRLGAVFMPHGLGHVSFFFTRCWLFLYAYFDSASILIPRDWFPFPSAFCFCMMPL